MDVINSSLNSFSQERIDNCRRCLKRGFFNQELRECGYIEQEIFISKILNELEDDI